MQSMPPFAISDDIARVISREQMAALPIRRYEGAVCMVATAQDLARAHAELALERVVGFDTETRPSFRKGEIYLPSLVQAATANTVYLFSLHEPQAFAAIAALLASPAVVKAGIALAGDMRALKQRFAFSENNVIDLGAIARRCGFGQTGLRNLAGLFLGCRIPKGSQTSNWAAPKLSAAQIAYAATDAWACRELYLRFESLGMLRAISSAARAEP
jgi:ribonuclease D